MINTIFFDWGGVIASDPGDDFLMQLLHNIGATEAQATEIFDTFLRRFMRGEVSEADFWNTLRADYGLSVHDTISEEFLQWRGLIVDERVLKLVDAAKAAGLKTAILSNVIEPTYNVLQQAGYYEKFDTIIASCKVGYIKPEPEIYQLALQQASTTAEQSLFIDDKQKNLDAAQVLGFTTVLAQNPDQIVTDVLASCPALAVTYPAA